MQKKEASRVADVQGWRSEMQKRRQRKRALTRTCAGWIRFRLRLCKVSSALSGVRAMRVSCAVHAGPCDPACTCGHGLGFRV